MRMANAAPCNCGFTSRLTSTTKAKSSSPKSSLISPPPTGNCAKSLWRNDPSQSLESTRAWQQRRRDCAPPQGRVERETAGRLPPHGRRHACRGGMVTTAVASQGHLHSRPALWGFRKLTIHMPLFITMRLPFRFLMQPSCIFASCH